MSAIWLVIKEFITSKKFIMAIAAAIGAAAMKIGLDLPVETVAMVLTPLVVYILAQGWADKGKEAAKVEGTVNLAMQAVDINQRLAADIPQSVKDKLL